MFNWFKNKIELKQQNCLMSSQYESGGFKINTQITVPEGFECLVYYNSKCYTLLNSGTHRINDIAKQILEKQGKKSSKRVKIIPHFVSKSNQSIEIKVQKNKYNIDFVVDDSQKFAEFVLLYAYKVEPQYALECVVDAFCELITYHKGNYSSIPSNELAHLGIRIISILPHGHKQSIFNTNQINTSTQASNEIAPNNKSSETNLAQDNNHFNELLTQASQSLNSVSAPNSNQAITISANEQPTTSQADTEPEIQQNSYTQKEQDYAQPQHSPQNNSSTCSKCGNVVKFKTTYCLRCGCKLDD